MLNLTPAALALFLCTLPPALAEAAQPIKVLIVSGGCCHDYPR